MCIRCIRRGRRLWEWMWLHQRLLAWSGLSERRARAGLCVRRMLLTVLRHISRPSNPSTSARPPCWERQVSEHVIERSVLHHQEDQMVDVREPGGCAGRHRAVDRLDGRQVDVDPVEPVINQVWFLVGQRELPDRVSIDQPAGLVRRVRKMCARLAVSETTCVASSPIRKREPAGSRGPRARSWKPRGP